MRWFSRRFRNPSLPRVAITVAAPGPILRKELHEQWRQAFRELDWRGIPATWAVVDGQSRWPLGECLLASRVNHELAFDDGQGDISSLVPTFLQQARLAGRIGLPLSTLVANSSGIHPSLLAQLGVRAVVPLASNSRSRTGSLRALAWDRWEAPITDEVGGHENPAAPLHGRLNALVRGSNRMHLLVRISPTSRANFGNTWSRFLDRLADYQNRGWIRIETVGQAAAEVAWNATRTAA